jgi:hypothetical protein
LSVINVVQDIQIPHNRFRRRRFFEFLGDNTRTHAVFFISTLQRHPAVGRHLGFQTCDLAFIPSKVSYDCQRAATGARTGCELVHARVIGIIHVVIYRPATLAAPSDDIITGHSRMGSTPADEQVSRPVGHPDAADASAGVSET